MRFREAVQFLGGSRAIVATVGCAMIVGVSGCGEDDFENNPRPPSPVEVTAAIDKDSVSIAPSNLDAGLVVITISNQTEEPTELVIEGPTDVNSGEIPPRGTGTIKTALEEGDYRVSTGSSDEVIVPAGITVGPPGESSQNDLLLP
ncbi:MAG: hypothetical protein WKF62_08935 [Solirubrobacterales bacterium]